MSFKVIKENILKSNDDVAGGIRERLASRSILMIDIVSSPGAGKTSFLENIGPRLKAKGVRFEILAGDCYTSRDAERIDRLGLPVVQINTAGACHIDAQLIGKALDTIDIDSLDLVIVENVGNLVCPACFDLGEDMKIAFLSTAEGHDKPEKYPLLVEESPVAVINKTDLLEHLDFDMEYCVESIRKINPRAKIMKMSCKTGEGIEEFMEWLDEKIKMKKEKAL
ncbi:MAG: hydrogenase nickel incorporation protein HypB [Candidatus Tantalella remota]|nr:hydrogenase nickel incorporation protein HypB [Candidatus Tantalella remota]